MSIMLVVKMVRRLGAPVQPLNNIGICSQHGKRFICWLFNFSCRTKIFSKSVPTSTIIRGLMVLSSILKMYRVLKFSQ